MSTTTRPGTKPKPGERDSYGRPRQRGIIGAEVYRSDDTGRNVAEDQPDDAHFERFGGTYGWVFGQIRVDPNDGRDDLHHGPGPVQIDRRRQDLQNLYLCTGSTATITACGSIPDDSNYLINVNDGGANVSYDGGKTWRDFHEGIPAVQFYNVAYDIQTPFWVYGSVQDQGTYRGARSRSSSRGRRRPGRRSGSGMPEPKWETAPGGEGTLIAVDPADPNTEYASSFYGRLERSEYKDGGWTSKEIYPKAAEGEPDYRGQWLAATMLSPHNPQVVYHGFQYLFRSMDKGDTWERISPDLTYNNPDAAGQMALRHPLRHDHGRRRIAVQVRPPLRRHGRRPGLDDQDERRQPGRRSRPGSPSTSTSGRSSPRSTTRPRSTSPWSAGTTTTSPRTSSSPRTTARPGSRSPNNIPGGPVNVVREDPKMKDILYAGTDTGIYVSSTAARPGTSSAAGLPTTYVWDIAIHPRDNALIIATNGRGMWIIDDLAPVQNAAK